MNQIADTPVILCPAVLPVHTPRADLRRSVIPDDRLAAPRTPREARQDHVPIQLFGSGTGLRGTGVRFCLTSHS